MTKQTKTKLLHAALIADLALGGSAFVTLSLGAIEWLPLAMLTLMAVVAIGKVIVDKLESINPTDEIFSRSKKI